MQYIMTVPYIALGLVVHVGLCNNISHELLYTLCVSTLVVVPLNLKIHIWKLFHPPICKILLSWFHLSVWVDGWCANKHMTALSGFLFGKLVSQYIVLVYISFTANSVNIGVCVCSMFCIGVCIYAHARLG